MAFTVSNFRQKMALDGARPNLFKVTIPNKPGFYNGGADLEFFAKSAQIPGATIGSVPVNYFGRQVNFAGNRTFSPWTMTILNDENFSYRSQFEEWMNNINSHILNTRSGASGSRDYSTSISVHQLSKTGDTSIRIYTLVNAFPTDLGTIDLDWGSNDTIEEFTVTFTYDYWTSLAGQTSGTGAGTVVGAVL